MPTYEYQCESCGTKFEMFKSMSAPSREKCPDCGEASKRLISAGGGMIIKGGPESPGSGHAKLSCGREKTCCGMDEPCGESPCGH